MSLVSYEIDIYMKERGFGLFFFIFLNGLRHLLIHTDIMSVHNDFTFWGTERRKPEAATSGFL